MIINIVSVCSVVYIYIWKIDWKASLDCLLFAFEINKQNSILFINI